MDNVALADPVHRRALVGLKRLNGLCRSDAALWPVLKELAPPSARTTLRVLDVACGGGDNICRLALRARRAGLNVELHGIDRSDTAIQVSRELAKIHNLKNVNFFSLDIDESPLPDDYDVVMCSLFLHHLDESRVVGLLKRMAAAARKRVVVSDLQRTTIGYCLAWLGCHLLSRSYIVHQDGPQSVVAAFSRREISRLAEQAGLSSARIFSHWPQRFLLQWDHP